MKILLVVCLFFLYAPSVLYAEHRQHGAHVHGAGELLIVLEGNKLELSFRIPGMDVIGFEHAPRTKEQKASIEATKVHLRKGDQLFDLTGTPECKLRRSSALFALTTHDHEHEDDEQREDHEETAKQDQGEANAQHAEFHVKHKYECAKPEALEAIVFKIFDDYASIEKVNTAFVINSEQSFATLTVKKPEIRIKRCGLSIGSWCLW